jgi:hypothetical protein
MNPTSGQSAGNCSFASFTPTSESGRAISDIASRRQWRISRFCTIALAGLLVVTACGSAPQTSEPLPAGGEWREFQGTWTAAGNRQMMRLGGDRQASIATFNGSLLLAGSSRPAIGFRAEAIVFNDSVTGMVGRAVWTDERGDQAYSELQGEGSSTGNKIVGTFLGGTGRYSGVTGRYELSWRFVLEGEDGSVQGQSIGLNGRIRLDSPQGTSGSGGPKS